MNKILIILVLISFSGFVYADYDGYYNNFITCSALSSGFCPTASFTTVTAKNITAINYNITEQLCLNNSCIANWNQVNTTIYSADKYTYITNFNTVNVNVSSFDDRYSSASATYFLWNTSSTIAGYKIMNSTAPPSIQESDIYSGLAGDQLIQKWINTNTNLTFIKNGLGEFHIHIQQTGGTKAVQIYVNVTVRHPDNTENQLAISETSGALTGGIDELTEHVFFPDTILNSSDMIEFELHTVVTGGGSAPTVAIFIEGSTASHLSLPISANSIIETDPVWNSQKGNYLQNASSIWEKTISIGRNTSTNRLTVSDDGFAGGNYILGVYADDANPWLAGFYNRYFSNTTPVFEYYGDNLGVFHQGTNGAYDFLLYTSGYTNTRLTIKANGDMIAGYNFNISKTLNVGVWNGSVNYPLKTDLQNNVSALTNNGTLQRGLTNSSNIKIIGTQATYNGTVSISPMTSDLDMNIHTITNVTNITMKSTSSAAVIKLYPDPSTSPVAIKLNGFIENVKLTFSTTPGYLKTTGDGNYSNTAVSCSTSSALTSCMANSAITSLSPSYVYGASSCSSSSQSVMYSPSVSSQTTLSSCDFGTQTCNSQTTNSLDSYSSTTISYTYCSSPSTQMITSMGYTTGSFYYSCSGGSFVTGCT